MFISFDQKEETYVIPTARFAMIVYTLHYTGWGEQKFGEECSQKKFLLKYMPKLLSTRSQRFALYLCYIT